MLKKVYSSFRNKIIDLYLEIEEHMFEHWF